jgi:hypothetical protein
MEKLKRNTTPIIMRNYGRIIQEMVHVAVEEKDSETREKMTIYIARCMRQKNLIWNKDQETAIARLKEDITMLSNGALSCDFPSFESEVAKNPPTPQPNNGKKDKQKNK